MTKLDIDIDIDVANRSEILSKIQHIKASIIKNNDITSHNSGIYLQNIPHNKITNLSTLDYKEAENRGYFKIDILNNSCYNEIKTDEELERLMNKEPMWELLEYEEIVSQLFQISEHCTLLKKYKPKSINQLAMILALIRPGKKHLIGKSYQEIESEIWKKPENGTYYFRKSHGIAYSLVIVTQMNQLLEKLLDQVEQSVAA